MKIHSLDAVSEEPVSHNPAIKKKVIMKSGEISNLVYFSRARFAPGDIATAHCHSDMSEVFFVESGAGVIRVDGTPHPLKPGTCIAVEPGEMHEVENNGFEELVLTYFAVRAQNSSP